MVTASHNPAEYNGIKFIAPTGAKVSSDFENAVSESYWGGKSLKSTTSDHIVLRLSSSRLTSPLVHRPPSSDLRPLTSTLRSS